MEKIQNIDHVASNLCNETVIPVYVVDNASEFVRKCKPYHIIDLKSDAYDANNAKSSNIDSSDKRENTSSLMWAELEHESTVNREEEQEQNIKSGTSNCAKLHVNSASSITTSKVASTQTPETRVNNLTECTLSQSLQQTKPYQMCFSSCFNKDDNCTHSHENNPFGETTKLDKVATYIPDDDDMS